MGCFYCVSPKGVNYYELDNLEVDIYEDVAASVPTGATYYE